MKNLIILILLILTFSCSQDTTQADAFGTMESTEIFVAAEMPGKIIKMSAQEGDQIQAGDALAWQDTISLYLQKGQLIASMNALKSQLQDIPVQLEVLKQREKILTREINRIEPLVKEGAATSKLLDDLQGELAVVNKQIKATQSQLSTANQAILAQLEPMEWQLRSIDDKIRKSTLTAPQNGTILKKFKESGEYAGPGIPLYKIADLQNMTARVYVTGSQLASLALGQQVQVLYDGPTGELLSLSGKVFWISNQSEFTPKTIQTREERVNLVYAVKVRVSNPEGILKIGMPIEIKF